MFVVLAPTQVGPFAVVYSRRGRVFKTLEAATVTAKRLQGRISPYGSNAILADFSDGFELEVIPDIGRRQTPVQALQARGLQ